MGAFEGASSVDGGRVSMDGHFNLVAVAAKGLDALRR
jgi:hypothetical protein